MSNGFEIDHFKIEKTCTYKGEDYVVRDNGSVFRPARPGKLKRPLDEQWTLGTICKHSGYYKLSDHRVHQIVATAFHGSKPKDKDVIDHIDTNKQNNRPENLRWVTKIENILLNPITAKRVIALYGSIEEFFANPKKAKYGKVREDFDWMRAVSLEEAAHSLERMQSWAQSSGHSSGGSIGEWVFQRNAPSANDADRIINKSHHDSLPDLVQSLTDGAFQRNWRVPCEFPLCPPAVTREAINAYLESLNEGATFACNPKYETANETRVVKASIDNGGDMICVIGDMGEEVVKRWALSRVYIEDGKFIHENEGAFFGEDGAEKYFQLALGNEWNGGDVFDDYC